MTLTFQKYVILDAKSQQTGSVKVKTGLCQGRNWSNDTDGGTQELKILASAITDRLK